MGLQLLVLLAIHFWGVVDGDEGFYLMASFLISQGKRLYIDFYYPQMPLLPYIYGGWMSLFGFTWEGGRSLSWIFSLGIMGLLFRYFRGKEANRNLQILMMVLYLTNGLTMGWFGTVKTQVASTFFTLLSFLCLSETLKGVPPLDGSNTHFNCSTNITAKGKSFWWRYLLAGISLGIAGNIRLLFLPLIIPVLFWVMISIRNRKSPTSFTAPALFCLGWGLAFLPAIYYFLQDPVRFYWNNLGYHLTRYPMSWDQKAIEKTLTIGKLLISPQSAILAILFVISAFSLIKKGTIKSLKDEWGTLLISISLLLISLAPSPAFVQYESVLIPFVLITIFPTLKEILLWKGRWKKLIITGCIAIYVLAAFPSFIFQGIARPHRQNPQTWSLKSIKTVGEYIRNHSKPGDPILSFWPGYLFTARRNPLPGLENHFGYYISWTFSSKEQIYFRLPSQKLILGDIEQKKLTMAVIGGWTGGTIVDMEKGKRGLINKLVENGYSVVKEIDGTQIFMKNRE